MYVWLGVRGDEASRRFETAVGMLPGVCVCGRGGGWGGWRGGGDRGHGNGTINV